MIPWFLRGLRDGVVTSPYPEQPDGYADAFPSAVEPTGSPVEAAAVTGLCPTDAICVEAGRATIDQGSCVMCLRCVRTQPEAFRIVVGSQRARLSRRSLVVPSTSGSDEDLARIKSALSARTRGLRRSVHVRHVDLGSDGSDEWEVQALLNPYYDVHRLGIFFTASPKHADVLLLTGAGSTTMAGPLHRTVEVLPAPYVVVASGTDAASGGMVAPTYAVSAGVAGLLPAGVSVDVWIPGSPPTPFALLHGLLLALGRLPEGRPA